MLDFRLFIAIAGVIFFYKAAQHENRSPFAWIALSVAASAVVYSVGGGLFWMVIGQVALLPLIAVWRLWREGDKGESH